jgi:magnesium transporter
MIQARVAGCRGDLPSPEQVRAWTPEQGLLWLDVAAPEPADLDYLDRALGLHPLVLEDLLHRNQRAKVDEYPTMLFVVLFGAVRETDSDLTLTEVHILLGDDWIATVSDAEVPALRALWEHCEKRPEIAGGAPTSLFHLICDTLVDSVFPILDATDEEIDRVETNIVERADESTVADIFRLKRDLNLLRRVLGPQRDLFQLLAGPRVGRLDAETQLYLRDVYDHGVRMVEQVDSYRDIITGALDVYLSSVSNRLGEQTRRLTTIATIFLPLTFLTGFFGMNFGALVSAIATPQAFAAGLVAMAVSLAAVYLVMQRLTTRARPLPVTHRSRRVRIASYTRRARRPAPGPHDGGGGAG